MDNKILSDEAKMKAIYPNWLCTKKDQWIFRNEDEYKERREIADKIAIAQAALTASLKDGEIAELKEHVDAWENLEAEVCPEDVGLTEYIPSLKDWQLRAKEEYEKQEAKIKELQTESSARLKLLLLMTEKAEGLKHNLEQAKVEAMREVEKWLGDSCSKHDKVKIPRWDCVNCMNELRNALRNGTLPKERKW